MFLSSSTVVVFQAGLGKARFSASATHPSHRQTVSHSKIALAHLLLTWTMMGGL